MRPTAPLLLALLVFLAVGCASNPTATATTADEPRPNVILIITDDQGYGDIAAHGNPILQTPHTDALHAESVRLTNFHVDPTCSPTRAALMTGRYAMRTGVWHTIQGRSMLDPDEVTLAEVLRDAGYATGMFGKWHLGDAYPCRPEDQGFTTVLTHGGGGLGNLPDYWGNDYFDDHYRSNTTGWQQYPGYCTDVWFEQATQWIGGQKESDQPFFCYLSTNAPHAPYLAPESYVQPYRDAGLPEQHAKFYGMITCIDDNLGRLMAYLDQQGLAENTIVIYMTDNGTSAGWMEQESWPQYNAGMTGFKGSAYEGGHRVPCFIRWPGGGIGGSADRAKEIETITAHIDLMPTILELCWQPENPELAALMDGQSLVPMIRESQGARSANDDWVYFVQSQRIERPAKWRTCCVMTDNYRLVNGAELYDLRNDPGQNEDLAARHPGRVAVMRGAYEHWWEDLTADLPDVAYILGDDAANPTTLTTHDLHHDEPGHDGAPWHQVHAERNRPGEGFFLVDIAQPGRYRFTLRRFPPEHGGATGAASATVSIAGQTATADADPEANAAVVELDLEPADHAQLRARLTQPDGTDRPAFFIEVERVD
ncbi:arylsulfatase [Phycisphaeraceae bacterium D3-23]